MELTGMDKAAILMVSLGKEYSAKIYKHLSSEEIERITLSITSLDKFDTDVKEQILSEFYDMCIAQKYVSEGGIDYARDILVAAMGEDVANDLLSKISSNLQVKPFEFVKKADTRQVFGFMQNEHPQTIALMLSYLDPAQSGPFLAELPIEKQTEIVKRMSDINTVSPEYLKEVERILEYKLTSVGTEQTEGIGGIDTIVEMLNAVDRATEKSILEQLEQEDMELADEIHKKMFVFEDISKLSNLDVQKMLKDVDNDLLSVALKGTTEAITEKIFGNVSSRLKETIKENMEFMGPVRIKDVEEAQQKIVNVIRRLEERGEIQIARGGGQDEFVG